MLSTFTKVATVETKLYLRQPVAWGMAVLLPTVLLLALGYALPGMDETGDITPPGTDLRGIDVFAPVILALALATTAVAMFPSLLATHREKGVLRRFSVTPASPAHLLGAQLLVNLIVALLTAAVVVAASAAFDVPPPGNVPAFVVALLLGTASVMAVGLLVAAVAPNPPAASAIGMAVYFPLLFTAGVWTPGAAMPDTLRAVADYTPLGAAVPAVTDAWFGQWPEPLHLATMAVCAVVCSVVAMRVFRWE